MYPLDAVFILGQGVAINYGDGQVGTLGYEYDAGPLAGQDATGWVWHSSDSGIFIFFLLWLNAVMPRFLRFSSIVPAYLAKLVDAPGVVSQPKSASSYVGQEGCS